MNYSEFCLTNTSFWLGIIISHKPKKVKIYLLLLRNPAPNNTEPKRSNEEGLGITFGCGFSHESCPSSATFFCFGIGLLCVLEYF
ncbi:MAG: hypothetical protein AUJ74_05165 [Candidatus Omnitrophica bacterium CG1_02_44_16]|nr:MAG: hypothetical protein AUJ74_05165 [Candidatus Omnitrophica bacterium CG1_02_44_16]